MRHSSAAFGLVVVCGLAASALAGEGDCRVIVGFKGRADAGLCKDRGMDVVDARGRVAVGAMRAARIARLRADPSVAYVEEDGIVEASAETIPPGVTKVWGSGAVPTAAGTGVDVAIIDTGISLNHPDLAANVSPLGVTFLAGTTTPNDDNGHGSHVAGVVAACQNGKGVVGVARFAKLHAVKVLDKYGSGFMSDVAKGVDWAAANHMKIANMSLGASAGSTTLSTACANAYAAGVLLVASAGNAGPNHTSWPAAYDTVIAVGGVDSTDRILYFSNTGPYIELVAPGWQIYSTYKGTAYKSLSGTSMAAPHVAGVAALIWSESAASTNAGVREELHARARDVTNDGQVRDPVYGYGVVSYPDH